MSTYRARVSVDNGTLRTARPLTGPDSVRDLVDLVVDRIVTSGEESLSVDLVIETPGESDTWIGDSIAATSSTPLPPHTADEDDDEPVTAGQA
jgi:hypothetical protein